ncbi:MAG: tRNA guanosine(34) transglycosylase Tgt [Candidatus Taylorbacteria bacterium]|nr:tRNA guanosine(34) transglycosylase Tgt [Candidatus Taylorbacteria bacterium]
MFKIENKIKGKLGRAGVIETPHGTIETPAFVAVGTQATVKALSPEQVKEANIDVVFANTYHLYLKPGADIVRDAGGLGKYMNWPGPMMTDSGGFQVFSLGAGFGKTLGKVVRRGGRKKHSDILENVEMSGTENVLKGEPKSETNISLVEIDEEGVDFRSVVDGSLHRFTPEKSIEIQHALGADIIFAFDECPSPLASKIYQAEALDRTLRWGERCLTHHKSHVSADKQTKHEQLLFGIIQGGRVEELRRKSALLSARMDFDGFGIGGSFDKEDVGSAVNWVNQELPEEKARHLLGIGDPNDMIAAIENGCDMFDCVAPTRMGRNGAMYTKSGRINITNAAFKKDFSPIDDSCGCYTCKKFTRSYVAHLFRSKEMFAATLASIHNLYFLGSLVKRARKAILENNFEQFKAEHIVA